MLEIRSGKTLQSKINVCKSDVKIEDCAHSLTYMIISELNRTGTGYRDENVNIESLYFADDGLLLANSI